MAEAISGQDFPARQCVPAWVSARGRKHSTFACIVCQAEFQSFQHSAKCCSKACQTEHFRRLYKKVAPCEHCGKPIPHRTKAWRFCSRDCAFAAQRLGKNNAKQNRRRKNWPKCNVNCALCEACGEAFTSRKKKRWCSKECTPARARAHRLLTPIPCLGCSTMFIPELTRGNRSRSCSEKCRKKANQTAYRACRRSRRARGLDVRKVRKRLKAGAKWEIVNKIVVFERDAWRCQICGCKTPHSLKGKNEPNSPELDHRIPVSKGGDHTYQNCQCLCRACNGKKSDRHIQGQLSLFANPLGKECRGT